MLRLTLALAALLPPSCPPTAQAGFQINRSMEGGATLDRRRAADRDRPDLLPHCVADMPGRAFLERAAHEIEREDGQSGTGDAAP